MATRMQQRRGTAAQWISTNSGQGPVLNAGEIGFESDTNKFKIGDGINHWVSLVYFTDAASALAAINAVIDAAPAALNTLNELAAAINDDPSFFTTIATNLSNHESDTTNVHGIADTSLLATKSYADTAEADAITAAGTAADTKISNAVAALTKSSVGLGNVDNTSDANKPVSTATQTALDLKAPKADPTFTGTVSGVTKAHVGLGNVDNTSDADKPVSTAQATAIATAKSEAISDATSQVNAVIAGAPAALNTLDELAAALGDDANFASTLTTSLSAKAPLASPTFTGTVSGVTATHVGLGNVDNTSDANKPVSTATQTALNAKASNTDLSDHTSATINVHGIADTTALATQDYVTDAIANSTDEYPDMAGDGIVWNATDYQFDVDSTIARLESPTFTGIVSGITKSMVGLENVDNTSDADKPVSTATQTALDAKLALAGGTMTGAITLPGAPTSDLHAATKQYVDNVTAGINFHESVHAASVNSLAANYSNGTSGVGATLTADTNRAFSTLDGESVVVGQRVLIKNQTDAKQNGIYTLTTNGSVSTPWVLTRATDNDNNPAGEMKTGDFCFVTNGATNASLGFVNNSTASPIVIGTDNISYTEFNAAKTIVAGNGLTEATPGVLSIDTSITQARVSGVSDTEIGYLSNVTSDIQSQIDAKLASSTASSTYAPINSPTFTGTVSGVTKSMVGLGNVDNTTDAGKPISTATQTALDLKAPIENPTFTGTVAGVTKAHVGLGNVDNTTDANKPISSATQSALDLKAPIASPTFTGTVTLPTGTVTSGMILDGTIVDGDISSSAAIAQSKVSGLTTDLGLKAPLASPALTGTPTAPTATAGTNSTQVATTAYADAAVAALVDSAPGALNTLNELAAAINDDASYAATITTALGAKAPLNSPTFTGTVDFTGATVNGISSYSAPTLGSTSIASGATVSTIAGLTLDSPSIGVSESATIFVAVASDSSSAATSTDGITWTARSLPSYDFWKSVTSGNNTFVAISTGNTSKAATSTDGITWAARTLPVNDNWQSVNFGNNTFVAVGYASAATSTDGITWTQRTLPSLQDANYSPPINVWNISTFGNNTFVALAINSTGAATSTDGITWIERTLPVSAWWQSVTYGNNTFVAVAYYSSTAVSSTDGITWTERTLPLSSSWSSVAYGNNTFAAITFWDKAATSTDGITWTERTLPSADLWRTLTYANNKFVAMADESGLYSTDGITWTITTTPSDSTWQSISSGVTQTSSYGTSGQVLKSTGTGVEWGTVEVPPAPTFHPVFAMV